MARGAAFFDLDRTLLAGASGELFSEAIHRAGLSTGPLPGEKFLYGLFHRIGETLPAMAIARQGVTAAKGRSSAAVREAAETVVEQLVALVQPFARTAFTTHRDAGRPIVLATTTPYDLVKPLADALGFDDAVATRYAVDSEGNYDGTLDGPFVWSAGKLAAVTAWAEDHDVDLAESWAYSDSFYDTPMLDAVGHPVVVNPDPRMVLMAAARRWPTANLDVSPGVVKIPVVGLEVQDVARRLTHPAMYPYARFDIGAVDSIPDTGPCILVGNHRSYFDVVAMSLVIAKAGRSARFLGKKEVFDAPIVGQAAAAMGGIRVDRATGSNEPLRAAADALDGGEMVALMPQGTIPRGAAFFDPELRGRWGAARLAQMTGAPVIPVGLWGTERVWPRSKRVPNVFNLTDPPVVRVRVGQPVGLKGRSLAADTKRIMTAIAGELPPEARESHTPTRDELLATFPPGYSGDPEQEVARRPGED
ncbi:HAD-IB family hydrolase [Ilumatobacter sp.]|uniref:HAD-IB family hydrolase n=1 Tax=Ilumatobacter sp. TaxID=1967498 RepID=UPI003C4F975D